MSLSEREQRLLREIEDSLIAEDPNFERMLNRRPAFGVGAVALLLVGTMALIGGMALSIVHIAFLALSVLGFLVMFGTGVWVLRGGKKLDVSVNSKSRPANSLSQRPSRDSGSLGSRMEDRFRGRFEQ